MSRSEVAKSVEDGRARPSLLTQIDRHLADPLLLPRLSSVAELCPGTAATRPEPNLGPGPDRTPGRVLAAHTPPTLARLAWPRWAWRASPILDKVRRILSGVGC